MAPIGLSLMNSAKVEVESTGNSNWNIPRISQLILLQLYRCKQSVTDRSSPEFNRQTTATATAATATATATSEAAAAHGGSAKLQLLNVCGMQQRIEAQIH